MAATSPTVHSVHFYQEDTSLIERLCGVVTSGLQLGDSILVVATAEHRQQLVAQLDKLEIDLRCAAREQRFTMTDAQETLDAFMIDGAPDREKFIHSVGALIHGAKKASRSNRRGLTVFGEMVSVLWQAGNRRAACQLEGLWNEVMTGRAFHLHCAYPKQLVTEQYVDQFGLASICQQHTHVLVN